MEISHLDVDEYYSPKDFQLGQTVTLLARSFLLCDCDDFTKKYYKENHPDMEMKPLEVPEKVDTPQKEKVRFQICTNCINYVHFYRIYDFTITLFTNSS